MSRLGRRKRRRSFFWGSLYLNPSIQYMVTITSAIVLAGFVFSGFLLFRYADSEDLISRGKRQMSEGKVAWAAQTFQTLVNKYRDSYEGHLLLGQAYLELNEPRKAEQEFRLAASLKSGKDGDQGPEVAMSKLAIAQGEFEKAEKLLIDTLRASKTSEKNIPPDVKEALFELYDTWGDKLMEQEGEAKDYGAISRRYERALHYAYDYQLEERVKEKLTEVIDRYAKELADAKDYEEAIVQLKKSVRYRYLPDTLVKIGSYYERMNNLDQAIVWYKKAFEADPDAISLQLTNVLLKKGRILLDQKKNEEAQKYFKEAETISAQAKLPMDKIYPIKVAEVQLVPDVDYDTGEFDARVTVRFSNEGIRPLNFLVAKAVYMSGDQIITEVSDVVATPEKPMNAKGEKGNVRSITVSPKNKLNIHSLEKGQLMVKIYIAYSEGEDPQWTMKAIQETIIKNSDVPDIFSQPV
jgi:tetratricopeptide (TPR) repeat protein